MPGPAHASWLCEASEDGRIKSNPGSLDSPTIAWRLAVKGNLPVPNIPPLSVHQSPSLSPSWCTPSPQSQKSRADPHFPSPQLKSIPYSPLVPWMSAKPYGLVVAAFEDYAIGESGRSPLVPPYSSRLFTTLLIQTPCSPPPGSRLTFLVSLWTGGGGVDLHCLVSQRNGAVSCFSPQTRVAVGMSSFSETVLPAPSGKP